jgi:hypothetical protein
MKAQRMNKEAASVAAPAAAATAMSTAGNASQETVSYMLWRTTGRAASATVLDRQ